MAKRKRKLRKSVKVTLLLVLLLFCILSITQFMKSNDSDRFVAPKEYDIVESTINDDIIALTNSNPNLVFRDYIINGIPVLDIYKDDGSTKPVIFFTHGLGGYKEGVAYILTLFANNGYRAIGIDALSHGEREEKESMFFEIVDQTANDLALVVDYYIKNNVIIDNNYAVSGVSMGGMISYVFATKDDFNPKMVVGISTCGNFDLFWDSYLSYTKVNNGIDSVDETIQIEDMKIADKINPSKKINKFINKKVLIYHSLDDGLIEYDKELDFYNKLYDNGIDVEMVSYDGYGHSVPKEFLDVMLNKIDEVLK